MTAKEILRTTNRKNKVDNLVGGGSPLEKSIIEAMEICAKAKDGQVDTAVNTKFYVIEQGSFDNIVISIGFNSKSDAESFRETMKKSNRYKDSKLIILKEC